MVACCTDGEQTTLELLIGPQKGLTFKFLRSSMGVPGSASADLRLAFFSGPHGLSAPLADFETVLLVASGLGIATQLPDLRHLIRGYNDSRVRTRQDGALAQDLLNQALKEDTLDDGYILLISVYYASGNAKHGLLKEGQHQRVSIHPGVMNLADLVRAEVAGVISSATSRKEQEHSYDEMTLVQEELGETSVNSSIERDTGQPRAGKKGVRMLVTVSASNDIRDNLREIVRTYLDENVSLLELEYQP
ncbi:hypothetical protein N7G274_010061 [Stereocaulon virgatum]|uniref:Uncharacterized protein n=1 Tax=Stereocaulon virgatum TaxID=373712 RepID=A0ABR3ZV76_9LECA